MSVENNNFDTDFNIDDDITEEIGQKEGEYIREYMPCLNTQIPKVENWNFFDINQKARTITFSEIIKEGN